MFYPLFSLLVVLLGRGCALCDDDDDHRMFLFSNSCTFCVDSKVIMSFAQKHSHTETDYAGR